ncbi:MAG: PepSY-associated TM helix domain-containing protein, partial [Pseudomonadota bacterium]
LFRDLYTAPRGRGLLSDKRDRHVLAAAWGLPFSVLLAFTGAFFSFAISLGLPVVALVAFGGDQEAVIETVIGSPEAHDPRPAPLASLDYVLMDSAERAGSPARSILIEDYGTAGSRLTVFHGAADGALTGTTHMFDGATRAFLGEKPTLGTAPSAGSAAVSLMAPLHFGNFAGLASKTAWFALGLAMSYVTATGMLLWVRRRQESRLWQRFARAIDITLWGLPVALLGSAVAYFLARPMGDPLWWTPAGFLLAAGGAVALGLRRGDPAEAYRRLLAALCLGLPLLRHLTGGASWSEVLIAGQLEVLTVDLLLICCGALLWTAGLGRAGLSRDVPRTSALEPAE